MFYQEHNVPTQLAPYIRCYWTLKTQVPKGLNTSQRFLSEGLEFTFNMAEPVDIENSHGAAKTITAAGITGPMIQPMRLKPTGDINLLGICFKPGGNYPFFKIPAHELTDQYPEVQDFWGSEGIRFVDHVHNDLLSTESRIKAISGYLSGLLGKNPKDDITISSAIEFIKYYKGIISVDELARYLSISCRHLERKFRERIGISPKQICRNIRFKHTYKKIKASRGHNWVDMALSCGYYDQAHLINDFKDFTGTTPTEHFNSTDVRPDFFTANF